MPRTFIEKDLDYMAKHAVENVTGEGREWKAGLEPPMSAREKVRRERIRNKAEIAIRDAIVAHLAGVLDDPEDDLGERVSAIQAGIEASIQQNDDYDAKIKAVKEEMPESVDF